jgi:hypothetical protein
MKHKIIFAAVAFSGLLFAGCKKYLDVNTDPASPQSPDIGSLFAPVTGSMSAAMLVSPISVGHYIQNWSSTASGENFDVHGGNAGGASANGLWRAFYAQPGASINLVIKKGIIEQKWDYVGAAIALRAWGLQQTTDYFGPMPYYQAWDDSRTSYAYDPQETIYKVIDSLCHVSISYLNRTDGAVSQQGMSRGDQVYKGDRSKWIKFVYGLLARNWNRRTNKADYNADSVIYYVDKSFTSNADNFYIVHSATRNDDTNPAGPARDNLSTRRQSRFIVQLLDGTNFYGTPAPGNRDPRIRGMLSVSPDTGTTTTNMPAQNGGYRFIIPASGDPNSAASPVNNPVTNLPTNPLFRQRPSTPYGDSAIINPALNNFTSTAGKYIFQNKREFPIMTFHELQFIKAEAAFRKNDRSLSVTAYRNGILNHFDFINFFNTSSTNPYTIPLAQRDAYMSSSAVKTSADITITDIMLQKYIGDWGWNLIESWADLRRFHYFDTDPETGVQVYRNFAVTVFSTNNQGPKPAYRYRPTNFSEYDWNLEELRKIGALNIDYHTYEMWFSQP